MNTSYEWITHRFHFKCGTTRPKDGEEETEGLWESKQAREEEPRNSERTKFEEIFSSCI